jgi:hypothetical protein
MFNILLSVFFLVQANVPALHSIGTGEGDVLPFIRPLDFIAPALHLPDEFFLTAADLHGLGHIVHQPELPAFALGGNPILPVAHPLAAFFIRRQNGQAMFPAQLIADGTELFQGAGILPQLSAIYKTDRVDYEVGVDVFGIAVGGHLHLMSGPCFHGELSGDVVGLFIRDVLPGREGLDILIEVDAVQFAVGILGGKELRDGIQSVTADATDIPLSSDLIHSFAFLQAVPHDTDHGTGMLPGFLDICYGRH